MDISAFIIAKVPPTILYLPNFITPVEEQHILDKVYASPKPKWTQLSNRRLQNWGGIPHPSGMIAEKIPEWLEKYVNKVNDSKIFGAVLANHVLVNEYLPGQGIMPHLDGPLFFPTISTISCGSHTVLEFNLQHLNQENGCQNEDWSINDKKFAILLERRSLVVVKDVMYEKYLHSISEITDDIIGSHIVNLDQTQFHNKQKISRDTRISLTIRHVPKTSKLRLKFCN